MFITNRITHLINIKKEQFKKVIKVFGIAVLTIWVILLVFGFTLDLIN